MKELYDKVIQAYKSGDENLFAAAARNWVEGTNVAPFENDRAHVLFEQAKRYCSIWRSKAINSRISKLRMVECIRKLAEMNLPNPYQTKQAEEPEIKAPEVQEIIQLEEPEHILGVVPNEEVDNYTVQVTEAPEEKTEEVAQAPEQEPAPKKIFGRHKKR